MKSRLETASYLAVLLSTIVVVAFFGQQEYDRFHPRTPPAAASLVGRTVSLPGVSFARPDGASGSFSGQAPSKTLILAISTTCHFCKDSEPFYQHLAAQNKGKVKMVAVLPQSLAEAQSYVQKSIAPSVQVVSSTLDSIGVRGTPTLLLVDGNGKVEKAWVGKLSDQGEKEVQALVM